MLEEISKVRNSQVDKAVLRCSLDIRTNIAFTRQPIQLEVIVVAKSPGLMK